MSTLLVGTSVGQTNQAVKNGVWKMEKYLGISRTPPWQKLFSEPLHHFHQMNPASLSSCGPGWIGTNPPAR
jgi:hypothetical protein